MAQISFALPPGLLANGTERQAAGRWRSANLVRWMSGTMRPIGGWVKHSTSAATGSPRALIAWKDNGGLSWIGIGTESHLYVMDRGGVLYDITPVGFTTGRASATFGLGYGGNTYGTGNYGTPRPDTVNILGATVNTFDTWGQNLVSVNAEDGFIYQWVAPTTGARATRLTNSPTATALVVTSERFLFALGTTDPRTVSWCDQQNNTVWTPTALNQAGSFPLQTFGALQCGKRLTGATGLWTDTDFWLATYIGGNLVYAFTKGGSGCGVASRQAVAATDTQAAWMGNNGFWLFDGFVKPLQCDVQDAVFSNINRTQISKSYAVLNSDFGEVWWFYPSAASIEIDSVAVWNYRENHWGLHNLTRLSGADKGGAFNVPLMMSAEGYVYEHETGFSYDGAIPCAETAPLESITALTAAQGGAGQVWQANAFILDDLVEGNITATFKTRIWPNDPTEKVFGPYTLTAKTDVRFTGRQVKLRIDGTGGDWRWGDGVLKVSGGGNR